MLKGNSTTAKTIRREQKTPEQTDVLRDTKRKLRFIDLVRTADTVADDTAKQEKLQERVDDWMSNIVNKMRLSDVVESTMASKVTSGGGGGDSLDLGTEAASFLEHRRHQSRHNRRRDAQIKSQHEREQKMRISQRQQAEANRQRQLILDGKLPTNSIRSPSADPLIKIRRDLKRIKTRKKNQVAATAAKLRMAESNRVKVVTRSKKRWTLAVSNLTALTSKASVLGLVNGAVTAVADDELRQETAMAKFILDNKQVGKGVRESQDMKTEGSPTIEITNPIYKAFECAHGVDDLYRIAEFWTNPNDI